MTAKKLILFAVTTSLGLAVFLGSSCFADESGTVVKSSLTGNFWFLNTTLLGESVQESKTFGFTSQTPPYFLISYNQSQWRSLIRLRAFTTPPNLGDFASYQFAVRDTIYASNTAFTASSVFDNLTGLPHTLTFNYTDGTSSTYDCSRYGELVPMNDNQGLPTLIANCTVTVTKKVSNWVHQIGFDNVVYNSTVQPFVNDYISYNGSGRSYGFYYGSSQYSYTYKTVDNTGGDSPSGSDATADALNDIHQDEKDTINDNADSASDSASAMDTSGFSLTNPLAPWLGLFTQNACVSIPKLQSWLHGTESQVCSPWSSDVRSNLTPIVSILSVTVAFGLLIHWLKSDGQT